MTGNDVKKLKDEEIGLEVKRLRDKLFTLRNQAQTEKVEDTSQFVKLRRDVARLLTERAARLHGAPSPASEKKAQPGRAPRAAKPAASHSKHTKHGPARPHAKPTKAKKARSAKAKPVAKARAAKTKTKSKSKSK